MGKSKATRVPIPRTVEHVLDTALDRALSIQQPAVAAYVARIRRRKPGASPAEVLTMLEHRYLAAVVGTGAAAGGAAALPAVGTAATLASGAAEVAAFVSATAVYVLALAEVYGIPMHDAHVRRALVLTVLLGDVGELALAGADVPAKHWARVIGHTNSKEIKGLNAQITQLLLARFGARQSALLLGRALPFGIGAGVGAAGNAALGRGVVLSARRAFGPSPVRFAAHVVDVGFGDDAHDGATRARPHRASARRILRGRRQ
jgi:hypothetical protein